MQDLDAGLAIIKDNPGRAYFAGPRSLDLINAAQIADGATFPPVYRRFLEELGAGSFGAFEIYGVTNANFEEGKVPNGIWLTLGERRAGILPDGLIIIGDTGDGAYCCLELGEGRVIVLEPGTSNDAGTKRQVVSKDFGEFFFDGVRRQIKN